MAMKDIVIQESICVHIRKLTVFIIALLDVI